LFLHQGKRGGNPISFGSPVSEGAVSLPFTNKGEKEGEKVVGHRGREGKRERNSSLTRHERKIFRSFRHKKKGRKDKAAGKHTLAESSAFRKEKATVVLTVRKGGEKKMGRRRGGRFSRLGLFLREEQENE